MKRYSRSVGGGVGVTECRRDGVLEYVMPRYSHTPTLLSRDTRYALAWAKRSGVARSRDALMPISGYKDYKRREYCKDIACPIQILLYRQEPDSAEYREIRQICKTNCIHSTYEFHHWLIENGYLIVRPEE